MAFRTGYVHSQTERQTKYALFVQYLMCSLADDIGQRGKGQVGTGQFGTGQVGSGEVGESQIDMAQVGIP